MKMNSYHTIWLCDVMVLWLCDWWLLSKNLNKWGSHYSHRCGAISVFICHVNLSKVTTWLKSHLTLWLPLVKIIKSQWHVRFGSHRSLGVRFWTCHLISLDNLIEGWCDFVGGGFMSQVITLSSLGSMKLAGLEIKRFSFFTWLHMVT